MTPKRLIVAIAAAALLAAPASASADGDPASDVLLQQDVFFPYDPPTSDGVARALLELTRRTGKAGWPIKVAIVATPDDLGAVSQLFPFPQRYTKLLAREIGKPRLLVVTPDGFGGQKLGAGADRVLEDLDPVGRGGDALARQALTAVARLAEEDGHGVATPRIDESVAGRRPYRSQVSVPVHGRPQMPIAASSGTAASDGGGSSGTAWWLYVAPVLVVVVVLVLQNRRERRAEASARAGEGRERDG